MTLYEICKELRDFEFEIDEETGEILNASELDRLELSKNEKIENICLYIKNRRSEADALKAEKDSFAAREKAARSDAERMTKYLESMLEGETFKSVKASVTYRKSEAVECEDITLVPEDFLRFKAPEINRSEIKKALKNGREVKGCYIVEKMNMQIK